MSKTTVQSNDPWAPAQPYIIQGLQGADNVFNQQQGRLNDFSQMQMNSYGRLAPGAESGISGAQNLVNDTLSGKFLAGDNPYLNDMIAANDRNVTNQVNGQFEMGGRYGGGAYAGTLGKALADSDNALRYQNYGAERQAQQQAVGDAQNLMGGSQSLLNNAADLPWIGVGGLNGNVRTASNGYGTQTTSTSDPWGTALGVVGSGVKAYSTFSDGRIKSNITPVGALPNGVGLFNYDMPDGSNQTGVLAQDVAQKAPEALGPTVNGLMTVNYPALGMDGPLKSQAAPITVPDLKPKRDYAEAFLNPDPNTKAGKIGLLGDALLMAGSEPFARLGNSLVNMRQQSVEAERQKNQDALDNALKQLQIKRAQRPQVETVGNTVGVVGDDGTFTPKYSAPSKSDGPTDAVRNFEYWKALPPGPEKDRLGLMLTGARFTAPAVAAEGQIADVRAAANAAHRAGQQPRAFTAFATNPQTGQRLGWDGRQWSPIQ